MGWNGMSKLEETLFMAPRMGTTLIVETVDTATFFMYHNYYGLSLFLSSVGITIGKLAIAVAGLLFGYLSDIRSSDRILGRRKFFLWIGVPLLCISFFMMFTPHLFISFDGESQIFWWLVISEILMHVFYGFIVTPYFAWMPELTLEKQRMNLSMKKNIFDLVGSMISTIFIFLVVGLIEEEGTITGTAGQIFNGSILSFSIFTFILFLPLLIFIKEDPKKKIERNIKEEFKQLYQNKNYLLWISIHAIASFAIIFQSTLILDFLAIVLGFNTAEQYVLFALIYFFASLIGYVFWTQVTKYIGKSKTIQIGLVTSAVVFSVTPILGKIPYIPIDLQGYLFGFFAVFLLSSYFLFPPVVVANIVETDERETQSNRGGIYTGVGQTVLNVVQSVAVLLTGFFYIIIRWVGPFSSVIFLAVIPLIRKVNMEVDFSHELL